MEMPEEQLSMRLMSMEGRVELSRLRSASLGDEEWARLSLAMKEIIEWNNRLIIDDTSYQTPATLRARTRRYVRKYGNPALIMVDYLQLIRSPNRKTGRRKLPKYRAP